MRNSFIVVFMRRAYAERNASRLGSLRLGSARARSIFDSIYFAFIIQ